MEDSFTDVEPQGGETQPVETPQATGSTGFAVPDAYKDAGWVKNIHSYDDLWNQHSNAQQLIGRKGVIIPNADSSEQDYLDFYAKTRPETVDGYDFDLQDDGDNALFKEIFYNNGISAKQAKAITDGYLESVRKASEPLFSADGFEKVMKEELGNEYQGRLDNITKFLKVNARPSQLQALENAPNELLGLIFGLIDKTMDKYAVKELGSVNNTNTNQVNTADGLMAYMQEKAKLEQNPFTTNADLEELKRRYGVGKYA